MQPVFHQIRVSVSIRATSGVTVRFRVGVMLGSLLGLGYLGLLLGLSIWSGLG